MQGCRVGRFFRIPTPSHKLFKFKKSTPTPHFFKTRLPTQAILKKTTPDSSNFEKNDSRLQLKTCDSTDSRLHNPDQMSIKNHYESQPKIMLLPQFGRINKTRCRPSMRQLCISVVVFKNEGSMVQTCRNINVQVVNTDRYMQRPIYMNVYILHKKAYR